jgi:SAM-dependent methyltransferase
LRPEQTLAHLARLRKYYPPDVAALALETAQLRLKAAEKFSRAEALFFTREALQQASSERVAGYHAEKLRGWGRVADLGCGIGGDSLAIGQVTPVLGLDRDPLRLAMARHNAAIYGAQADFIQADLSRPLPWRGLRAAFFDPTRRMGEKRLFSVHDYLPPLDVISTWTFEALWVKLSPGLDRGEVASLGGGLEFISEGGDLKAVSYTHLTLPTKA